MADIADSTTVRVTEALVREHQAALWRYLRVLGCSVGEAEDLAQEAFLALLRARQTFGSGRGVRAWLRATAKNQFFARCRQQRREPRLDADLDAAFAAYERDDDGDGYRQALRACIEALSAREREVLQLRYHEGKGRSELAQAAGVSAEGAKSLLRRIKIALRNCVHRKLNHGTPTVRS